MQQASPSGDTAVSPLLGRLDKVVRNWYAIAKPIQMVAGAKGTTHELSQEVAAQIRSLGIYLYNEHSLLGASQRIVGPLQDAFGSIPEIAERAADDARALDEVAWKTETEAQVKPVYELCTKALEAIKGNPGGGAKEATNVLATGKPLIKRLLKDGLTEATVIELEDVIALTVLRCATTHGNASNNWVHAISLLEQAVVLAHDEEILNRIETNLATARQNHRLFKGLKPISSAPSLLTVNGFGFAMYGNSDYDRASASYMATYYFVALFVPIFPICRYRVISTADGYRFLGKGPLRSSDKWHLALSIVGILTLIGFIQ